MSGKRARQIRKSKAVMKLPREERAPAYNRLKKLYTKGLIVCPK